MALEPPLPPGFPTPPKLPEIEVRAGGRLFRVPLERAKAEEAPAVAALAHVAAAKQEEQAVEAQYILEKSLVVDPAKAKTVAEDTKKRLDAAEAKIRGLSKHLLQSSAQADSAALMAAVQERRGELASLRQDLQKAENGLRQIPISKVGAAPFHRCMSLKVQLESLERSLAEYEEILAVTGWRELGTEQEEQLRATVKEARRELEETAGFLAVPSLSDATRKEITKKCSALRAQLNPENEKSQQRQYIDLLMSRLESLATNPPPENLEKFDKVAKELLLQLDELKRCADAAAAVMEDAVRQNLVNKQDGYEATELSTSVWAFLGDKTQEIDQLRTKLPEPTEPAQPSKPLLEQVQDACYRVNYLSRSQDDLHLHFNDYNDALNELERLNREIEKKVLADPGTWMPARQMIQRTAYSAKLKVDKFSPRPTILRTRATRRTLDPMMDTEKVEATYKLNQTRVGDRLEDLAANCKTPITRFGLTGRIVRSRKIKNLEDSIRDLEQKTLKLMDRAVRGGGAPADLKKLLDVQEKLEKARTLKQSVGPLIGEGAPVGQLRQLALLNTKLESLSKRIELLNKMIQEVPEGTPQERLAHISEQTAKLSADIEKTLKLSESKRESSFNQNSKDAELLLKTIDDQFSKENNLEIKKLLLDKRAAVTTLIGHARFEIFGVKERNVFALAQQVSQPGRSRYRIQADIRKINELVLGLYKQAVEWAKSTNDVELEIHREELIDLSNTLISIYKRLYKPELLGAIRTLQEAIGLFPPPPRIPRRPAPPPPVLPRAPTRPAPPPPVLPRAPTRPAPPLPWPVLPHAPARLAPPSPVPSPGPGVGVPETPASPKPSRAEEEKGVPKFISPPWSMGGIDKSLEGPWDDTFIEEYNAFLQEEELPSGMLEKSRRPYIFALEMFDRGEKIDEELRQKLAEDFAKKFVEPRSNKAALVKKLQQEAFGIPQEEL